MNLVKERVEEVMYKSLKPLFKLYIFLLPFALLNFLVPIKNSISGNAVIGNNLFILAVGIFFILIICRFKITIYKESYIFQSIIFILELVGLSAITSTILFIPFGTLFGENTLTASFSRNVYLILCAFILCFNFVLFKTLNRREIEKILDLISVFLILLGVLQILVIYIGGIFSNIYDRLDIFNVFADSSFIIQMKRICLTGSEPAAISDIVCVLILPYTLSNILDSSKNKKIKYIVFSSLLTIISFFSFSSSVYIGVFLDYILFIILRQKTKGLLFILLTICIFLIILVILNLFDFFDNNAVWQQINALLFEKTTSTENQSTMTRYSTIINDIMCFIKYPITGVGNGNQGFLFNQTMNMDFVPSEMRNSAEVVRNMNGYGGVVSGGSFLPSFISGYGLIGIYLLIKYVKKSNKQARLLKTECENFYYTYIIGGIVFLCLSVATMDILGNFIVMFVISIPLMYRGRQPKENKELINCYSKI